MKITHPDMSHPHFHKRIFFVLPLTEECFVLWEPNNTVKTKAWVVYIFQLFLHSYSIPHILLSCP